MLILKLYKHQKNILQKTNILGILMVRYVNHFDDDVMLLPVRLLTLGRSIIKVLEKQNMSSAFGKKCKAILNKYLEI